MSLTEQLEKAREASKTRIPEPALNVLRQAIKDLADTGIADETVKPPQDAPKFALKNATGETVDLDALLDKPPQGEATESPMQRYQLTLLKRFSQSTRPSRIKTNVEDLLTLRELYHQIDTVADALDLTQEGVRYYATSVLKSAVFQIARRAEEDRYLHLVCFVTHQFFRLQDLALIDLADRA